MILRNVIELYVMSNGAMGDEKESKIWSQSIHYRNVTDIISHDIYVVPHRNKGSVSKRLTLDTSSCSMYHHVRVQVFACVPVQYAGTTSHRLKMMLLLILVVARLKTALSQTRFKMSCSKAKM